MNTDGAGPAGNDNGAPNGNGSGGNIVSDPNATGVAADGGMGDPNLGIIIGCVVGGVLFLIGIVLVVFYFVKKRKQSPQGTAAAAAGNNDDSNSGVATTTSVSGAQRNLNQLWRLLTWEVVPKASNPSTRRQAPFRTHASPRQLSEHTRRLNSLEQPPKCRLRPETPAQASSTCPSKSWATTPPTALCCRVILPIDQLHHYHQEHLIR
jgi:hypothetical protein